MSHRLALFLLVVASMLAPTACSLNLQLLPENLVSTGTSFVLKGTATVLDSNGPCLAWIGDNGIIYHLFQSPTVENAVFDHITTPGVTSRLQIATRTDLQVSCQVGTIVEVLNVLEVVN